MKKLITLLLGPLIFMASCSKEPDFNYPADTVGGSKIIYYPAVKIVGDKLIIIDEGSDFTDPGVTATFKGEDIESTIEGTVDTNTPGVYEINYSASSPNGYSASDFRTVVVMSADEQVTSNDFSGTYKRPATGVNSTWTKTGRGIYQVENPGGAGLGVGFIVTLVNYEGNKIAIPKQNAFDPSLNGLNTISSNSENYDPGPPATVTYALTAGQYGDQLRNFIKL